MPSPSFLLFHSLLVSHPSFLVQLSLREVSCGNYFDQQFQMQSFPPFPFYSFRHNQLCVIFSLCLYLFSLTSHLFLNSTFLYFFFCLSLSLSPQIPARDCSWRGRGGQGHGLTLGSIDDLCICVFVLCVCVCVCVCPKASLLYF